LAKSLGKRGVSVDLSLSFADEGEAAVDFGDDAVSYPTFTGTRIMVSLPKMSITFTARV
jgi:hypothetical protein